MLNNMDGLQYQEQTSNFPNNFKDLPHPYGIFKDRFIKKIQHGNLDALYGLRDSDQAYTIYHATLDQKLGNIARDGLKAFFEQKRDSPRIFVTPSPTLALWHAIENGPHDTLRKKGVLDATMAKGKPVLLQLQLNKDWLSKQNDITKPLDPLEYIRLLGTEDVIGTRSIGQLNRLRTFHDILQVEIDGLKRGNEATNLGIPLPVDYVPADFIYVDTSESVIPIREWLKT